MGGSQLKQLRSTLKEQGLSSHGPNQNKKRKRSSASKGSGGPTRAEKLAAIHESFNTFDTKLNKRKFESEQQKKGKPGQSKQAAIEQRRKTLLPELQNRNRTGGILDRRIGESDNSLTAEERALERFALEQQRLHASGGSKRRSGFNLEEEDELTHLGRSLAGNDPDVGNGLADQQDAFQLSLKRKPVDVASDSDDEEAPRKKSRAEIMDEVIKKSKMYKHERQKAREEDDELRLELDDGLDELRAALRKDVAAARQQGDEAKSASEGEDEEIEEDEDEEDEDNSDDSDESEDEDAEESDGKSGEPKVDRALLAQLLKGDEDDKPRGAPKEPEEPQDAYDQAVKELTFERRVRPTDRLKTEDERIREAADALREAEESRQRRMRGESDQPQQSRAQPGGDDLDDGLDLGDAVLGQGLQEEGADDMEGGIFSLKGEASGSDEDEDASENDEDDDDEDDDDDDDEAESDLAAELEEDENDVEFSGSENEEDLVQSASTSKNRASKAIASTSDDKMGFVFPCPDSHAEFLDILADASSAASLATVIERIRTLHHPRLAPENNDKLSAFLGVLLDHVLYLAATAGADAFEAINVLAPHILSLSNAYPLAASTHFRTKLSLMHKNFLRGASKGVLSPEAKTWPGPQELVFLRLVGLIWSTSDLSHPVVAPALLLICEYLEQARIRSTKDIQSALFLCTLVLQYESISKRIVPEVLNLLNNAVLLLAPHSFTSVERLPGVFPTPDVFRTELASLKVSKQSGEPSKRLNFSTEAQPADLLYNALVLIEKYAELWVSSVSFVEMMGPLQAILNGIISKKLPSLLQDRLTRTINALDRMLKLSSKDRRPLRLQSHKPVPIPTFIPKFEEGFQPGRPVFDPDTARNETAKLKALVKKERKGAIRELRKDNRFIAEERAKMRDEKDQAYNAKIRSIMAGLETERAEEKDYERAKARAKSRDRKRAGGGGGR